MSNKFPNTSILIFITQTTDSSKEKLLFIYLKPVPDFYSQNKVYWYDKAGKNGKGNNVWEKLAIKQWSVCGKDSDIIYLFDTIISTRKINIDKTVIHFIIAPFSLISNTDFYSEISEEAKFDILTTTSNDLIPQEFYQKENLKLLSGYKSGSAEIKPLYPFGLIEDGFIYNSLDKQIWGIKEHRTAYLTFRGIKDKSNKTQCSNKMIGFYQQKFDSDSNYFAVASDNNLKEIGRGSVDKKNGLFEIIFNESYQKGRMEILVDNQQDKSIKYVLIQDIKINLDISQSIFKDTYDREFTIPSSKVARPTSIDNFTWQRNIYSDSKEADKDLSDLFKSALNYLGPKIIVADPFFVGNFKKDSTTDSTSLSHCQAAFINALIHSAIEQEIEEINILGYFQRAKNQINIDKADPLDCNKADQLFQTYEQVFRKVIPTGLQKYSPKFTINFLNTKEYFHNRYWFSLTKNEHYQSIDKCIVMTNSLGNINEVDMILIQSNEETQFQQITRKYTKMFKDSVQKLRITNGTI